MNRFRAHLAVAQLDSVGERALSFALAFALACALVILAVAVADGQTLPGSPGVVAVQPPGPGQRTTWVRGTAGTDQDADKTVCTMTVNRSLDGSTSNMHLECYVGIGAAQRRVAYYDISVPFAGMFLSFGGQVNRVSILLARGMPAGAGDRWEMTANDPANGGMFKTGLF